MVIYGVTAARYDENRKLSELQGQETHGLVADTLPSMSTESRGFSVPEVLKLIEGGDEFYLVFGPFDARTSGGLIIPDGKGSLTEKLGEQGKLITDLPTF
ncbi:hypothetical protein D3C76_546000 [compost metagenome]